MPYFLIVLFLVSNFAMAESVTPAIATPEPGQILVSGTVPDEASKAGILTRLRELYGADKVVDQIAIGRVVLPANWNSYVQKLIDPDLKQISKGQLKVDGNTVSVKGEVANEVQRQQIASNIAGKLNPTFVVNNGLRVSASQQNIVDNTLKNRIVEFESGKATLTPVGAAILDELGAALLKIKYSKLEVIGHTDNSGLRTSNIALSKARAETVKLYLAQKGIASDLINTFGQGPDSPVASNDTTEGRARNRRIEFRVAQ